jgi:hypothetical protein
LSLNKLLENSLAAVTHANFENAEVVWAKRPALPWFPGIVRRIMSL